MHFWPVARARNSIVACKCPRSPRSSSRNANRAERNNSNVYSGRENNKSFRRKLNNGLRRKKRPKAPALEPITSSKLRGIGKPEGTRASSIWYALRRSTYRLIELECPVKWTWSVINTLGQKLSQQRRYTKWLLALEFRVLSLLQPY